MNIHAPTLPTGRKSSARFVLAFVVVLLFATQAVAHAAELVVYSGRSQSLVAPIIEAFTKQTGIKVSVRYGDTAELAALILEEGNRSRADVFWAQDAGALGAVQSAGRLAVLPKPLVDRVDERYRSPQGRWVGTSARARVIAYNTSRWSEKDLPKTIWEFTDPKWSGKIGWAPTNASFQAFVTALRVLEGEKKAEEWLRRMMANKPKAYGNNVAIVDAIGRGEIDLGLVNHYYIHRFIAERGASYPVRYYHLDGDAGGIVNVAGVGILGTAKNKSEAEAFVDFLLSKTAQDRFVTDVFEYALLSGPGIAQLTGAPPLASIKVPKLDLGDLKDLEGTLELLQRVGVL